MLQREDVSEAPFETQLGFLLSHTGPSLFYHAAITHNARRYLRALARNQRIGARYINSSTCRSQCKYKMYYRTASGRIWWSINSPRYEAPDGDI